MLEVLVAASNCCGFDLRAFFSYLNAEFLFAFFEFCVPQTAVIAEERECGVAFSECRFVSVFAVFDPVVVVAFVGFDMPDGFSYECSSDIARRVTVELVILGVFGVRVFLGGVEESFGLGEAFVSRGLLFDEFPLAIDMPDQPL